MKNSKKIFILTEAVLAVLLVLVAFLMLWEKNGKEPDRIAAVIQDSGESRWAAFKYGLREASEDAGVELVVVSVERNFDSPIEEQLAEHVTASGADAVILQPVQGVNLKVLQKTIGRDIPIMLVENPGEGTDFEKIPVTGTDNYAVGEALAGELLTDSGGTLAGKTIGILLSEEKSESILKREEGFRDALSNKGADIAWTFSGEMLKQEKALPKEQQSVDFVIALDDESLTAAGEASAANNLKGALVYGIGNSTEAVYYLDLGEVQKVVVPDDFSRGYRSLTEIAKKLHSRFYKMKSSQVDYTVLSRETLFNKENQELLFTMNQ